MPVWNSCTYLASMMMMFFIICNHRYLKKQDEESPHEESSYSLTDYVCFKIPDGSLNKTNCIGVMKDSGNCCTALSMASLSGFLLHIPDEYECVDLSLYKVLMLYLFKFQFLEILGIAYESNNNYPSFKQDKQIVLLLNETSCADSPGKSWMVMLRTENFSFMPLSGTFPANIYSLQKLVVIILVSSLCLISWYMFINFIEALYNH